MNDITQLPVMSPKDANSIGYAAMYQVPHLPIDVPDGGFTLTAKTSDGRRVTIYFGPTITGKTPGVVMVQYHDSGMTVDAGDGTPTGAFDAVAMGPGDCHFDTRMNAEVDKPCVIMIPL